MLKKSKAHSHKGTTSVEFAIVAQVFLLLIFGIIQFCKLFYMNHLNTNAVREIARFASVNTGNSSFSIDQHNLGVLRNEYTRLTGVNTVFHPAYGYPLLQVSRGTINNIGFIHKDFNWIDASNEEYICAYGEVPVDLDFIFFKKTIYLKAQCCIRSEAL